MINNFYVFIPARGGSKSIKDKNLQEILGIPLVERSIKLALKRFDRDNIVISSDSQKILKFGDKYSISLHLRSEETSTDNASTETAIREWLLEKSLNVSWIILLEPTSPFINLEDLDKIIELCSKNPEEGCIHSISEVRHTDHFLNQRIKEKNKVNFLFPDEREKNRLKQKKIKTFKFGNISSIRADDIRKSKSFFSKNSLSFTIPYLRSINIDSIEELLIARSIANYEPKYYHLD